MTRLAPGFGRFPRLLHVPAVLALAALAAACAPAEVTLTLDPEQRFQTLDGWQVGDQCGQIDAKGFADYADELFERTASELGINRMSLAILPSIEHERDVVKAYLEGKEPYSAYKPHSYEAVNDDDDPRHIVPAGFHWTELDFKMERVFLPLRKRVEARGEKLGFVLTFVDFEETAFEHRDHPEEYAELIEATFLHLQAKYGVVPDLVEAILEPDAKTFGKPPGRGWTGQEVGRAIVAAAKRLAQHGFTPGWIAPSTTSLANAPRWFADLASVPGALAHVKELSYHRYRQVDRASLAKIGALGREHGIRTSMLEWIGADHHTLHDDLVIGGNGAWQQFVLAYPTKDNGAQHYLVREDETGRPRLELARRSRLLRPYFLNLRRGDVRIAGTADSEELAPVAFAKPDGALVAVLATRSACHVTVKGLPAGSYATVFTPETPGAEVEGRLEVVQGQAGVVDAPAAGVLVVRPAAR